MRYIFSFFIPPLGILLCGKWIQAIANLLLWVLSVVGGIMLTVVGIGLIIIPVGWLICSAWALSVCKTKSIDKRVNRIVGAIQAQRTQAPGSIQ